MKLLGTIVRLQVQREPLKVGKAPLREFRTDSLVPVARLLATTAGVVGVTLDGEHVLDVHHQDHPRTRDRRGTAGFTIMSVGDYRWLESAYGLQQADQAAGNTILIDAEEPLAFRDFSAGLIVRTEGGDLDLDQVRVADPCVEFSRFCMGLRPDSVIDGPVLHTLSELDHGRRGYRGQVAGEGLIAVGDRVFAR
ncbi:hypothetical protein EH165_15085 [Nakamurella antarctica]|uniref:MOSC domain-containing protein n=1 Tax=Nakamurella antarctica TaxID=1902245 RepID=A0A3G8ZR24_9ACTN|nr:hypothetical protein [Nakamurella antarctica]AZI59265.1 hypothetical protein EH165_15085 [Nakamurella antarctica]